MAYATEAEVRVHSGFLRREEAQNNKTGTTLTLPFNAYAIASLEKNGTALTEVASSPSTGEFSFSSGNRNVTLGDAAVSTDWFLIVCDVAANSSLVTTQVTRAETIINGRLKTAFGDAVPWSTAPSLIKELTKELATAYILRSVSGMNNVLKDAGRTVRDMIKEVMNQLDDIADGKIQLIGETLSGATLIQIDTGEIMYENLPDVEEMDYYEYFEQDKPTTKSPRSF